MNQPRYGIRATQKGTSVDKANDSQLIFSSEWPLLKIHSHGPFSVANTTQDTLIATHGLGFTPVFWVFDTSSSQSRLAYPGSSQYIAANGTDLKWLGLTRSAPAGTFSGYYYIFRADLATTFTAARIQTPRQTPGDQRNFGIKATTEGHSTQNSDLRHYTVHSNTRSPMVHQTTTGSLGVGGGTVTVAHGLGHEPMFFLFASLAAYADGRYQMIATADDSFVTATTIDTTFHMPSQCTYSLIIFKDPVLLA